MGRRGNDARRRGSTLATALIVVGLLMTLAFTAAALGTSQLQLTSRQSATRVARDLAEAAVSTALGRLRGSHDVGKDPADPRATVTVSFPDLPPESQGLLTFDPSKAAELGITLSTNNFGSESSRVGSVGTIVPGDCVQLVGTGRSGGVEHRVEVILYLPRFPFVVASTGPVSSSGGLVVAAVSDEAVLADGLDNLSPDQLLPGNLATNAASGASGAKAVKLQGAGNRITGDVQAVGEADVGSGSVVVGEIREHARPATIPNVPILDYDTADKPGLVTLPSGSYGEAPLRIEGFARRDGSLQVSQGLRLDGGVLFVNGDLHVDGGVSGKGALIVNGRTEIVGGGQSTSDNLAALLSKGDTHIRGTSTQRASFHGLLYTEGNLSCQYVNLAGTFISNNANPAASAMSFENTTLVQYPQSTDIRIGVTTASAGPTPTPAPASDLSPIMPNTYIPYSRSSARAINLQWDRSRVPFNPATNAYEPDLNHPVQYLRFTATSNGDYLYLTTQAAFESFLRSHGLNAADSRTYGQQLFNRNVQWAWEGNTVNSGGLTQLQSFQAALTSYLSSAPTPSPTPSPGATPQPTPTPDADSTWTLDLSQFTNVEDRIRIYSWRDI